MAEKVIEVEAVVVGAGPAGLSASRALSSAGVRCVVLESRSRVGGRAHTAFLPPLPVSSLLSSSSAATEEMNKIRPEQGDCFLPPPRSIDPLPVDLGASWIHGHGLPGHLSSALALEKGVPLHRDDWDSIDGAVRLYGPHLGSSQPLPHSISHAAAGVASLALHRSGTLCEINNNDNDNNNESDSENDNENDNVGKDGGCVDVPADTLLARVLTAIDNLISGRTPEDRAGRLAEVDGLLRDGSLASRVTADRTRDVLSGCTAAGLTAFSDAVRWFAARYAQVEGTAMHRLSGLNWELGCDEGEGGLGDHMVMSGYGRLLASMADDLRGGNGGDGAVPVKIELNTRVVGIRNQQQDEVVHVTCEDGRCYRARAVIVTVPLGVLKSRAIRIDPSPGAAWEASLGRLGVGLMNKVVLQFAERFWPEGTHVIGLSRDLAVEGIDGANPFQWFMTLDDRVDPAVHGHVLVCLVSADEAWRLEGLDPESRVLLGSDGSESGGPHEESKAETETETKTGTKVMALCLRALRTAAALGPSAPPSKDPTTTTTTSSITDAEATTTNNHTSTKPSLTTAPDPTAWLCTAWGSDRDAMGSWSSFALGSGPADAETLRFPTNAQWEKSMPRDVQEKAKQGEAERENGVEERKSVLLFAGEYTSVRAQGCVHGAMEQGDAAARCVLKSVLGEKGM